MENVNSNPGFVKLPRAILEWEWYEHPDVFRVLVHLMLKVNYKPMKWQGQSIDIGEHITSIDKLSTALALSKHKTRESLKKLSVTGYIKLETTNHFTKVRLLKLDGCGDNETGNQKPFQQQFEQQIKNQPIAAQKPTETKKKDKKEKEIEERRDIFKDTIFKNSNSFSKDHLESFYSYWSIENKETGRLRFEEEKYWNLEFKIKNWQNFTSKQAQLSKANNRP